MVTGTSKSDAAPVVGKTVELTLADSGIAKGGAAAGEGVVIDARLEAIQPAANGRVSPRTGWNGLGGKRAGSGWVLRGRQRGAESQQAGQNAGPESRSAYHRVVDGSAAVTRTDRFPPPSPMEERIESQSWRPASGRWRVARCTASSLTTRVRSIRTTVRSNAPASRPGTIDSA